MVLRGAGAVEDCRKEKRQPGKVFMLVMQINVRVLKRKSVLGMYILALHIRLYFHMNHKNHSSIQTQACPFILLIAFIS